MQLIKSTTLTSIIGFEELVGTSDAINNATFEPFKVYGLVALILFASCFPLAQYARWLERRAALFGSFDDVGCVNCGAETGLTVFGTKSRLFAFRHTPQGQERTARVPA